MRYLRHSLFTVVLMILCGHTAFAAHTENFYKTKEAVENFASLKEMHELWPSSTFKLTKEHGREIVKGRVLITPHWEFQIVVPIQEQGWDKPILQIGSPEITFREITEITMDMHDVPHPTYDLMDTRLTTEDWIRLYHSGGDFSTIGIHLNPAAPIPNLDLYLDYLNNTRDY